MAQQRFSGEDGIVDEKGKPVTAEKAPEETAAQRAAVDADVNQLFKDERPVQGERKFGKPPA